MSEQTKKVKLSDIVFDQEIYPREQDVWLVAYQYSQAMKAGAVFPPIVLGEYKKKLYLIDGRHRMNAYGLLKKETVDAIIKKYNDKKSMFIDSVKFNNIHGKALTVSDKAKIYGVLKNWDTPDLTISTLLNTPIENFSVFIKKLSGPIEHREVMPANVTKAVDDQAITPQEGYEIASDKSLKKKFINRQATQALDNAIAVLENNTLSLDMPDVRERCVKLLDLLQKIMASTDKVDRA